MSTWIAISSINEIPKEQWLLVKLVWCGKPTMTMAFFDAKNVKCSRIGNIGGCFLMDLKPSEFPTHYMVIPEI